MEVLILTKPPLPHMSVVFEQGGEEVALEALDANGTFKGEVDLDPAQNVVVSVGDDLRSEVPPSDLKRLRFITTSPPRLSNEEAMRRWKRVQAGLPPDWLDEESVDPETLAERQNEIAREAFKYGEA